MHVNASWGYVGTATLSTDHWNSPFLPFPPLLPSGQLKQLSSSLWAAGLPLWVEACLRVLGPERVSTWELHRAVGFTPTIISPRAVCDFSHPLLWSPPGSLLACLTVSKSFCFYYLSPGILHHLSELAPSVLVAVNPTRCSWIDLQHSSEHTS